MSMILYQLKSVGWAPYSGMLVYASTDGAPVESPNIMVICRTDVARLDVGYESVDPAETKLSGILI